MKLNVQQIKQIKQRAKVILEQCSMTHMIDGYPDEEIQKTFARNRRLLREVSSYDSAMKLLAEQMPMFSCFVGPQECKLLYELFLEYKTVLQ